MYYEMSPIGGRCFTRILLDEKYVRKEVYECVNKPVCSVYSDNLILLHNVTVKSQPLNAVLHW
jgi:hypothetical protein